MTKVPLNIVLYYILPKIPQTHGTAYLVAASNANRITIKLPFYIFSLLASILIRKPVAVIYWWSLIYKVYSTGFSNNTL